MKILFLQNTDDALGGIVRVNISLIKAFLKDGHEVSMISLRHSGKEEGVDYPILKNRIVINEADIWMRPRYCVAVQLIKKGQIIDALKVIIARGKYDYILKKDYKKCKEAINRINPDVIINSHYELLNAISENKLSKTINHFHTSFDQVCSNKSYYKTFEKYKMKIAKFVWLTKETADRAIKAGFTNSTYVYNPISFTSDEVTDYRQKNIIFLGRISPEKRLDRAVRLFNELISENEIFDWNLYIYGPGEFSEKLMEMIEISPYVHYCGTTDNVKGVMLKHSICVLTSEFEGMALVVLEANECGVPVVCFDFGESVYEEVLDKETGFIINQNDEKIYKEKLLLLMKNDGLREQMGKNAKNFSAQFEVDSIKEKWYRIIEEIEKN